MSTALRRSTRSASRALSETSEPAETAGSAQSSRSEPRRTRRSGKPTESIPKETHSYGTDIPGTLSQQLAAQAAMMKPVHGIETRVEQAAQDAAGGYARGLSVISEERQTGGEIFGQYQTFGRENGDSLNLQNQRQSPTPSINRDLSEELRNDRRYSHRISTLDSIVGSIRGIFRSAGWLLPIFYVAAAVIFLYFIARWYPVMKNPQGSGYNCSSLTATECPPLPTVEIERLGRRLDDLEGKFRAQPTARRINWLSFDMGARAIIHLSSPNEYFQMGVAKEKRQAVPYKKPGWLKRKFEFGYQFVLGSIEYPVYYEGDKFDDVPYGPTSALQPYRENEVRYCTLGKLQLAVKLPRSVTPLHVIVEHYLKDEVVAVGTAPKEVELWIPIGDHIARAAVVREITEFYPDILPGEFSEPARFLEHKIALDFTWVPVGRWTYDIHANEAKQKFRVIADLESHNIAVDEVVIRVNSNWGNQDVTCLVRARLDAIDRSGVREELDAR